MRRLRERLARWLKRFAPIGDRRLVAIAYWANAEKAANGETWLYHELCKAMQAEMRRPS